MARHGRAAARLARLRRQAARPARQRAAASVSARQQALWPYPLQNEEARGQRAAPGPGDLVVEMASRWRAARQARRRPAGRQARLLAVRTGQQAAQNEEARRRAAAAGQGNLVVEMACRRQVARCRQASSSAAQKEEALQLTSPMALARTGPAARARFSEPPWSAEEMSLWDIQQSAAQKEEARARTIHLLSCV